MELRTIIFCLIYSMFWGGGITFIVFVFINGVIMPFRKNKALREARDKGHEIIAKRVDFKHQRNTRYVWGYYEFEYNKKKYKFHDQYFSIPPMEETLYFKKNPKKAKPITRFGHAESGYGSVFMIATLIIFFIEILG